MKPLSVLKTEQVRDNPLEEIIKEKRAFHFKKEVFDVEWEYCTFEKIRLVQMCLVSNMKRDKINSL